MNISVLLKYLEEIEAAPSKAERNPSITAHWIGGARSRIEYGDLVTFLGGDNEFNPMQMLLVTLAACDVDLIVMHASLLGIDIESLSIEADGQFNVQSYLGLDKPGSGYKKITYKIKIKAPGITEKQINSSACYLGPFSYSYHFPLQERFLGSSFS